MAGRQIFPPDAADLHHSREMTYRQRLGLGRVLTGHGRGDRVLAMSMPSSHAPRPTDWIAAELRGGQLCAWGMTDNTVSHRHQDDRAPQDLFAKLEQLAREWGLDPAAPVLVSGLPGAPHLPVPVNPLKQPPARIAGEGLSMNILATPALAGDEPGTVMHGDALRIAGFLSLNRGWDGVICQAGPAETTWALVSADEIVSFQGSLTPVLFDLISKHLGTDSTARPGGTLSEAVDAALSRPERMARQLWAVAQRAPRDNAETAAAPGQLLGTLIGAELASARPYWLGQQLAVIGAPGIAGHYAAALEHQGVPVTIGDEEAMTLAGFVAARRRA